MRSIPAHLRRIAKRCGARAACQAAHARSQPAASDHPGRRRRSRRTITARAPGIWLEDDRGRWVAMLPGVPREMRGMLRRSRSCRGSPVRERARAEPRSSCGRARCAPTGIAESALAESASATSRVGRSGLPLAYLPGTDGVDLAAHGARSPAAEADRAAWRSRRHCCASASEPSSTARTRLISRRCRAGGLPRARLHHCRGRELHRRAPRRASHCDPGIERCLRRRRDRL